MQDTSNKKTILYVDDEQINLRLFDINFSKKYKVLVAQDGNNGLEVLEKNPDIDIIVSDMKMPLMDGIQFIRKAKDSHPEKQYYILTGFEITKEINLHPKEVDEDSIKEIYRACL